MKANTPVLDMALEPKTNTALQSAPEPPADISLFERFARDPAIDVDKLERLMQMHERATARFSQEQFNAAMAEAQREMRPIAADAYNPSTKSHYASYEALDGALRPIYTAHGFGLSFNTGDCPLPDGVRVVCDVTHRAGHSKPYHIDMPADGKGAKGGDVMTRTHATGAAVSYGMRYLLKMIFNVAVGESDDDGNTASAKKVEPVKTAPAGFDQWRADIAAAADEGFAAFGRAWNSSAQEFRTYLVEIEPRAVNGLKDQARAVDTARKAAR